MNYLYPGLEMRVVPSIAPGGTLEFALDTHREAVNAHSLKEFSTGRILARQFLVPFLLGFKFNVVSIIPILFGLLALLAKKAVIISKIALIVASAFGLGTLLLGNINNVQQQYQSHPFNPGFGGHGYKYQGDEYQEVYYRTPVPTQTDQLRLYDNIPVTYNRREELTKGRNFAWSEDEKVKNKIVHENR
ncbi:hypothetical protein NQ318_017215 [Aromia moschata]|uniref:Uncharacterized protein n=1 Tax=Aromia moschata TaxID=1265417 RepID=A0AAV8YMA1_9CUCU|nr:hypothetical protein NQ318_017215 [Aromia moschata]